MIEQEHMSGRGIRLINFSFSLVCQIALTRELISITTYNPLGNWHDTYQTSYFPFTHLTLGAYPIRRLELAQSRHTACEEN